MQLLVGSDTPLQDAAKGVIKQYVTDAIDKGRKVESGKVSLGDVPIVGTAAKNYASKT
jgi:hypothetical protein